MSMPKTPDTKTRWNQASIDGLQPELTRDNSPEQTEQHLRDSMVGRKYGLEDKRGVSATDPMETVDRTNKFISEFASAIRKLVSDQLALTNTVPDNSRVSLVNEWLGIALADEQVVQAFERMDVENASKLIEDVLLKRAIQFALHDQSLRNTSLTSAELDALIKEAEERMRQKLNQSEQLGREYIFPQKMLAAVAATILAIILNLASPVTSAVASSRGNNHSTNVAYENPTPTPVRLAMNPDARAQTLPTPTPDVRPTLAPAQIATATPAVRPTQAELPPQNTAEVITYTLATVIKDANIRSGPGTTYPIVGGAKTGDEFKVIGEVSDTWVKIEFVETGTGNHKGNNYAFIHSSLVSTREINEKVKGENTGGAVNTVAESDDPGQAVDGEAAEASPYPVDVELTGAFAGIQTTNRIFLDENSYAQFKIAEISPNNWPELPTSNISELSLRQTYNIAITRGVFSGSFEQFIQQFPTIKDKTVPIETVDGLGTFSLEQIANQSLQLTADPTDAPFQLQMGDVQKYFRFAFSTMPGDTPTPVLVSTIYLPVNELVADRNLIRSYIRGAERNAHPLIRKILEEFGGEKMAGIQSDEDMYIDIIQQREAVKLLQLRWSDAYMMMSVKNVRDLSTNDLENEYVRFNDGSVSLLNGGFGEAFAGRENATAFWEEHFAEKYGAEFDALSDVEKLTVKMMLFGILGTPIWITFTPY